MTKPYGDKNQSLDNLPVAPFKRMGRAPGPAGAQADLLRRGLNRPVGLGTNPFGSGLIAAPGLISLYPPAGSRRPRSALSEAASLWEQLPASAKQQTADWAGRLKARLAAENAARRLVSSSLSGLDAATR